MFISCAPGGRGGTCRGPWWWASRGWWPGRFPFLMLKLCQQILQKRYIYQTFSRHRNNAFIDVSIAHNLFHGTSGAKPADHHGSCRSLLIHLCWNMSFCFYLCFSRQLRWFWAKEFIIKFFFLMQQLSFESVPEISMPPCILRSYPETSLLVKTILNDLTTTTILYNVNI